MAAVEVEGLVKKFKETTALAGVDLEVPEGTVLGLLGPNGAGKTTVVRILSTLLKADAGTARIFGQDVIAHPNEVRSMIGLTGQYAAVDEYLTGQENLEMIGRLYHLARSDSKQRATTLLERFDLADAADRIAKTYSGGMRRRLDIAASLIARPRVLFLDEPTTGLDPRSRIGMWEFIASLVSEGTTILLTTQYLEEADRLADGIVVIDHGKVIARGTADQLKSQVGGHRLEFTVSDAADLPTLRERVAPLGVDEPVIDEQSRSLSLPVRGGAEVLRDALRRLDDSGVTLVDVGLRRPDLDDVFLILTGHASEASSSNGAPDGASSGGGTSGGGTSGSGSSPENSSDGATPARSGRHAVKGADQ